MKKVGITGQTGFIGSHLYNTLGLNPEKYQRVDFADEFFYDESKLEIFVEECDVIVHLAAVNRHSDPSVIYNKNLELVERLLSACDKASVRPYLLFSSSTQEEKDNLYGKSKKEGREKFAAWAQRNGSSFTGFVIPNVFGPFGKPFYNSVVATFCYQLTHGEKPAIDVDSKINLIYVGELVQEIINKIDSYVVESNLVELVNIRYTYCISVSDLLKKLEGFGNEYLLKGELPDLSEKFDLNLFNTFLAFIDHRTFFPFKLNRKEDERGMFIETVKLKSGGQVSFSVTKRNVTRGNHFHTRKAERFAVIRGKAQIEIRKIGAGDKISFQLDGEQPSFVDMPVWYTHNITNTGDEDLYTVFWINEIFDQSDPDTYFEKV